MKNRYNRPFFDRIYIFSIGQIQFYDDCAVIVRSVFYDTWRLFYIWMNLAERPSSVEMTGATNYDIEPR